MKTRTRFRIRRLALLACVLLGQGLVCGQGIAQETEPPPEPETSAPQATPEAPPVPEAPRYVAGANRTFQDVASDIFFWGQSATFSGTLLDNVFAGGQMVNLDGGTVGGDLFAFAATATIDGEVMGDVYAFASQVRVTEGAVIHGNLTAFTGSLQIDGTVVGHVLGGGGGTVISGDVGPVEIEAGSLTVAGSARVRGDLAYESNNEADIAEGARIDGAVRWSDTTGEEEDEEAAAEDGGIGFWDIAWTAWRYVSGLIVGAVLLLVGGRVARQPALSLAERPASSLGFGFVVAVVFPVACLVAIVLLVTLPLGVLGLVVFGVLLFLARLVAAQYFGAWLLQRLGTSRPVSEYASLALGLAVLLLIAFIPYLGFLIRLVAMILGLGGIYLALRHFGFPSAQGAPSPAPSVDTGA